LLLNHVRYNRFILSFFVLVLFAETVFAGELSPKSRLNEGIQSVYNFDFDKAELIFSAILKKNPNDLFANHFSATLSFWKYFGSNKQKYLNDFLHQSDITISKAEDELSNNPKNKETLFILGAAYSYRAIAYGKAEKFLDMIWTSKKSNSYLENVLEIDSAYYDAYLGIGLIKFALSQVPSGFKWALSMIGFDGDSEKGLSYLKICAEKGNFSRVESEYYLSQLYAEFYFDYDKSKKHLVKLNQQFPGNLLFDYSLAVIEVKNRNLNSAENILLPLVKRKNHEFEQLLALSKFLLADVYFYESNFAKAKDFYLSFLSETKEKNYSGIANYRLAICSEFLDEPASNYYKAAQKGNEMLDDDFYAMKKSEIYLRRTISEVEKSLIFTSNLLEQKKYDTAIDSLTGILNRNGSVSLRGQMFLLLSEAYYSKNNYDSSLIFAQKAIGEKSKSEQWVTSFAYYFASASSVKKNDSEKAKYYFGKADDFSDFYYENKLKGMLKNLSRFVKN
jgi:tetratricopeptide (TPR) repeat protein